MLATSGKKKKTKKKQKGIVEEKNLLWRKPCCGAKRVVTHSSETIP